MAITEYKKQGQKFYKIYVQARGKTIKQIRLQKVVTGIETIQAARREEKRLIKELAIEVSKLEGRGLLWSEILHRWQISATQEYLVTIETINDHISRLKRYTGSWMKKVASELTPGDGRRVLEKAKSEGAGISVLKKIKTSINMVFKWGIEEGLIKSESRVVMHSPVYGLQLDSKAEKTPPILTLDEVKKLLFEAKLRKHPWYPVWAFAILTGMRRGEMYALQWKDVDEANRIIRVERSYNSNTKKIKCPKNGKWRNVSISPQLLEILAILRQERTNDKYVLPRLAGSQDGYSAKILREFLRKIGIDKNVVFHTLRACFATHLLAAGAEPTKVMRMGGWSDLKTFQIYLRLAGVDVKGVSDPLDVLPRNLSGNEQDKVVSLFDYK